MSAKKEIQSFKGYFMGNRRKYSYPDLYKKLEEGNYSSLVFPIQDGVTLCWSYLRAAATAEENSNELKKYKDFLDDFKIFHESVRSKIDPEETTPYEKLSIDETMCLAKCHDILEMSVQLEKYFSEPYADFLESYATYQKECKEREAEFIRLTEELGL